MVLNADRIDRRNPAVTGAHWLVGAAVTLTAAVIATILAIVFAATMAVVVVIVGGALGAWAAVARLRAPKLQRAKASGPMTLDARKVGHAWVAYGWDQ